MNLNKYSSQLFEQLKNLLVVLIKFYQGKVSAYSRRKCRYSPSCSNYMIISIRKYGLFLGFLKGIKRLMRCRPPYGGIDKP